MQQWARFAILGAMFVTAYLLILAWQKDYGNTQAVEVATPPAAVAQAGNHAADLPTQQNVATTDIPQANVLEHV